MAEVPSSSTDFRCLLVALLLIYSTARGAPVTTSGTTTTSTSTTASTSTTITTALPTYDFSGEHDVVIIMDRSESVNEEAFTKGKVAMANIIGKGMTVHPTRTRLAVMTFASNVTLHYNSISDKRTPELKSSCELFALNGVWDRVQYDRTNMNGNGMAIAINMAEEIFHRSTRKDTSKKTLWLIGDAHDAKTEDYAGTDGIKRTTPGLEVYGIGTGQFRNFTNFMKWVSDPASKYYITREDWSVMIDRTSDREALPSSPWYEITDGTCTETCQQGKQACACEEGGHFPPTCVCAANHYYDSKKNECEDCDSNTGKPVGDMETCIPCEMDQCSSGEEEEEGFGMLEWILIGGGGFLFIVLVVLIFCCCCCRRAKKKETKKRAPTYASGTSTQTYAAGTGTQTYTTTDQDPNGYKGMDGHATTPNSPVMANQSPYLYDEAYGHDRVKPSSGIYSNVDESSTNSKKTPNLSQQLDTPKSDTVDKDGYLRPDQFTEDAFYSNSNFAQELENSKRTGKTGKRNLFQQMTKKGKGKNVGGQDYENEATIERVRQQKIQADKASARKQTGAAHVNASFTKQEYENEDTINRIKREKELSKQQKPVKSPIKGSSTSSSRDSVHNLAGARKVSGLLKKFSNSQPPMGSQSLPAPQQATPTRASNASSSHSHKYLEIL